MGNRGDDSNMLGESYSKLVGSICAMLKTP